MGENRYLRPCPFCGEAPQVVDDGGYNFRVKCEAVECQVEPSTIPFPDRDEAVEVWNSRAD